MSKWFSVTEIKEWHNDGIRLKEELIKYNWEYRKKICSKCTLEQQAKLHCLKVNHFVDGIQETHCKKLVNARTKKNKKRIEGFIESHPLRNGI